MDLPIIWFVVENYQHDIEFIREHLEWSNLGIVLKISIRRKGIIFIAYVQMSWNPFNLTANLIRNRILEGEMVYLTLASGDQWGIRKSCSQIILEEEEEEGGEGGEGGREGGEGGEGGGEGEGEKEMCEAKWLLEINRLKKQCDEQHEIIEKLKSDNASAKVECLHLRNEISASNSEYMKKLYTERVKQNTLESFIKHELINYMYESTRHSIATYTHFPSLLFPIPVVVEDCDISYILNEI